MLNKILAQFDSVVKELDEFVAGQKEAKAKSEEVIAKMRASVKSAELDINKATRVSKKISKLTA